jgi:hypothetical protein
VDTYSLQGRTARYASTQEDWDRVVASIRRVGRCGLDTEFYGPPGWDVTKSSCVDRAQVHVWSIAVAHGGRSPRGYQRAAGVTLPAEALSYGPVRKALEDPTVLKDAHNASIEYHVMRNVGITLRGLRNTLPKIRWVAPGRAATLEGFTLKQLMIDCLGRTPLGSYEALFSRPAYRERVRHKTESVCSCGARPCRRRGPEHVRTKTRREWTETAQSGTELIPLHEIVPGHALFTTLVVYASEDAEAAEELASYAETVGRKEVVLPW